MEKLFLKVKWKKNKLIYDRVGEEQVLWTIYERYNEKDLLEKKLQVEKRLGIVHVNQFDKLQINR